jgi:nicotinamide mononucleotide transporter
MESLLQATAPLLAEAFTLWGSPTTWLEVAAFVLAVWMVFCNMRVDPLGWPLAIVSSLLYALLFAHSKLYGEASLQLFFVAVSGWGWWQWLRGRGSDGTALKVHRTTLRQAMVMAALTLAAWPALAAALARFTDSDVPWLDALPTVGSIAGQFLLGRKLIENWPVWLAVNLVSLALFGVKGLWLTVALYAVFALLSVAGWRAWRKIEGHVDAAH